MKCFRAIVVIWVVVAGTAAGCLWLGGFNISAQVPHWEITYEAIEIVRDSSIKAHRSRRHHAAAGRPHAFRRRFFRIP